MVLLTLSTISYFSNIAMCSEQKLLNMKFSSDIIACSQAFINFAADYCLNLLTYGSSTLEVVSNLHQRPKDTNLLQQSALPQAHTLW